MNNKGFTLVELLVTLAIMGIITGLAFPAIMRVRTANQNKKYEAYEEAMLTAAKLYVDKYKVDLNDGNNCVTYDTLVSSGFLKEYKEKGSSINDKSKVYVYFYKDGNSISNYKVSLVLSNGYNSGVTATCTNKY